MDTKIIDRVLDLALTTQQIPAPTFDEGRRAMFVYEYFLAEGLTEVSIDAEGNVYGKIPGTGLAPPLVVSAHLDTVFPVSTVDHNRPSAVHELAGLVTRLLANLLPEQPRSILNVGVIAGGTTVNTNAAEAHLELDLRSEEPGMFADLAGQVESLVNESIRTDVQVTAEVIGQRPAGVISADHPLVRLVIRYLEAQGIIPSLNIGSTDANFLLSRSLPAICLGLTTGGSAHSLDEFINIRPLGRGLEQLAAVVEGVYQVSFNNFHIPD